MSDAMIDELKRAVDSLSEAVESLSTRIVEIESKIEELENSSFRDVAVGGSSDVVRGGVPISGEVMKAFLVYYDLKDKTSKVFVPDGCLYWGTTAAEFKSASNGSVVVDIDSGGATVYCHVVRTESEESESVSVEATIDTNEGNSDDDNSFSFTIARIKPKEPWNSCQYVSGMVIIPSKKVASSEVKVDDDSIDKATRQVQSNDTNGTSPGESPKTEDVIELREFQTGNATGDTIATHLAGLATESSGANALTRNANANGRKQLTYVNFGKFVSGNESNVKFSSDGEGTVKVDVYYI